MPEVPDYHNRQLALAATIRDQLCCLYPSTYGEIAPEIEYWIEYGITEEFVTTLWNEYRPWHGERAAPTQTFRGS